MTGVGKAFVYELARKKLGKQVDNWLDSPHVRLSEHPTPRAALESCCAGCIHDVAQLLEAI